MFLDDMDLGQRHSEDVGSKYLPLCTEGTVCHLSWKLDITPLQHKPHNFLQNLSTNQRTPKIATIYYLFIVRLRVFHKIFHGY